MKRPTLLGAAIALLVAGQAHLTAEQNLLIDLTLSRTSTYVKDAGGSIVEWQYKTPLGVVTITPSEDSTGRISGAVAKLGAAVIATAKVLRMGQNVMEIEETQFRIREPHTPVYVGTIRYNGFRDRIEAIKPIRGTRLYIVFNQWVWSASP